MVNPDLQISDLDENAIIGAVRAGIIERLLSAHDSQPQNPIIANVLYKSKVLESWGRGIALMVSECLRVGLPSPEFHTDGAFVWVVFRYASTTQEPDKSPISTDQDTDQATDQVVSLANAIGSKSLSAREIMALLGLNHRPSFRSTYLHPSLDGGYIVPLYPEQPSNPKQKYRLTEKGRTFFPCHILSIQIDHFIIYPLHQPFVERVEIDLCRFFVGMSQAGTNHRSRHQLVAGSGCPGVAGHI